MDNFEKSDLMNFVYGLSHLYPENIFYKNLSKAVNAYPSIIKESFLADGQLVSKRWLINELKKLSIDLGVIYLVPGWYGMLAHLIDEAKLPYKNIRSFDLDADSVAISELMNRNLFIDGWKFKATCMDVLNINYSEHVYLTKKDNLETHISDIPETIINTACEHLDYVAWLQLIPQGKLVVLQNNDFFDCEGHIQCVKTIEEFKEKCNLSEVYYSGMLPLKKYNRFMLIGKK